jgi:hypothetical protein
MPKGTGVDASLDRDVLDKTNKKKKKRRTKPKVPEHDPIAAILEKATNFDRQFKLLEMTLQFGSDRDKIQAQKKMRELLAKESFSEPSGRTQHDDDGDEEDGDEEYADEEDYDEEDADEED